MVDITNPIFHDEAKAVAHLEASRWPDGPFCPYCGSLNVHRMAGKTQAGMFLCNDCRDKFTARRALAASWSARTFPSTSGCWQCI